ncbi:unnamed protein product [Medioppia subpectinata]|uniref:FAST kinase leucine-rich domain-containing protein n=1 Tax=Medioppia subpectinata TaxID=1979941 RepID=A0A7R9QCQ7_9ACAR|nr:unnamed protein product [Medioppia subpectinata]CAG2118518.1 unnamed protein product [Medioppia subpectinata]
MFLRLNPLKRCLNALNCDLNVLSVKCISNSVYSRGSDHLLDGFDGFGRPKTSTTDICTDLKANPNDNQFISDRFFRKEVLQTVFSLSQNMVKGNRSLSELIESSDWQVLCQTIEDNVSHMKNRELINTLHSFLVMNISAEDVLIQCLENDILWRAKHMTLKDLLVCLQYHVRYQTTDQQKRVVNEMIINLVTKLDTAEDDDDIIQMLSLWQSLSPQIIEGMESMAIEMIGRSNERAFKLESLSYILVLLSQMNRRTKPLIDAVVNRFTYESIDPIHYREKYLIRMLSSLNQLNYVDINFLKKTSDLLCNRKFLDVCAPSDRRDLLVAISHSNWSYPRLLNEYIEKITDTNNDFSPQDYLVFVSTAARLHSRSNYLNEVLFNYVIPYVRREDLDPHSWLLYVWSLSILGCVPLIHVKSVMNHEFYNQLMNCNDSQSEDTLNYKQIIHKLKLLNIKGVAELEMNEKIDFQPIVGKNHETIKREATVEKFRKNVFKTLVTFGPNFETNISTPFGFSIDAEFIANKDNEFLSLQEYGVLGADPSNSVRDLPQGFQRCALMCFGFKDSLLGESGLIGTHELSIRLLRRMGYNVIAINQTSLPFVRGVQINERLKAIINKSFD